MAFNALISCRVIIGILGSVTAGLVYSLRINLSVAILAMVNQTYIDKNINDEPIDVCYQKINDSYTPGYASGTYKWSQSLQGVILGSYFYGYAITQIIGGRLTERWGAKWVCVLGVIVPAILNALSPIAADTHEIVFIVIRVLIGAFHGLVLSSIFSLYSKWYPVNERTTAIAGLQSGGNIGACIFTLISGYLCEHGFADGWPSVYYVGSAVHVIWLVAWLYFVHDTPANSPRVSADEHIYILQNIDCPFSKKSEVSAPWKSLLCSGAVWSSVVAKTCGTFGYYVLATSFPSYLDSIFDVHIFANSIYTALIYLAMACTLMIAGPLSTVIKTKTKFSLTRVRKLFQEFALLGPAICLILVSVIGCNKIAVIALIVLHMCMYGFTTGGEYPIVTEFAPEFSGTIFGFSNTFASVAGIIAPIVVGLILEIDNGSLNEWNLVFYLTATIYLIGVIFFELFASADRQVWDKKEEDLTFIEMQIINSKDFNYKNKTKIKNKPPKKRRLTDTTTPEWLQFKKCVYVY